MFGPPPGTPSHMKGKSWEEIYGVARAQEMRAAQSTRSKGNQHNKGKHGGRHGAFTQPTEVRLAISATLQGRKLSNGNLGQSHKPLTKLLISQKLLGNNNADRVVVPLSDEDLDILIRTGPGKSDSRQSAQYYAWRELIYRRDRYVCKKCGTNKGLNPHHIKSWNAYPELRYEVDNGITLCTSCHAKEGNNGRKENPGI